MEKISTVKVRKVIVDKIKEKYGMSVREFSRSEYPVKWGINPANLTAVLSTGSSSFRTYEVMYQKLGLGKLHKQVKVTKKLTIFVEPKK